MIHPPEPPAPLPKVVERAGGMGINHFRYENSYMSEM